VSSWAPAPRFACFALQPNAAGGLLSAFLQRKCFDADPRFYVRWRTLGKTHPALRARFLPKLDESLPLKFSIVILASNDGVRREMGRQIAAGFQCLTFGACAVRSALELIQHESPDLALVHHEFAQIDGHPIERAIAACCAKTRTLIFHDQLRTRGSLN
jgi:hypothetical protein